MTKHIFNLCVYCVLFSGPFRRLTWCRCMNMSHTSQRNCPLVQNFDRHSSNDTGRCLKNISKYEPMGSSCEMCSQYICSDASSWTSVLLGYVNMLISRCWEMDGGVCLQDPSVTKMFSWHGGKSDLQELLLWLYLFYSFVLFCFVFVFTARTVDSLWG